MLRGRLSLVAIVSFGASCLPCEALQIDHNTFVMVCGIVKSIYTGWPVHHCDSIQNLTMSPAGPLAATLAFSDDVPKKTESRELRVVNCTNREQFWNREYKVRKHVTASVSMSKRVTTTSSVSGSVRVGVNWGAGSVRGRVDTSSIKTVDITENSSNSTETESEIKDLGSRTIPPRKEYILKVTEFTRTDKYDLTGDVIIDALVCTGNLRMDRGGECCVGGCEQMSSPRHMSPDPGPRTVSISGQSEFTESDDTHVLFDEIPLKADDNRCQGNDKDLVESETKE